MPNDSGQRLVSTSSSLMFGVGVKQMIGKQRQKATSAAASACAALERAG